MSFASDRKGYGVPVPGVYVIPEPNAYRSWRLQNLVDFGKIGPRSNSLSAIRKIRREHPHLVSSEVKRCLCPKRGIIAIGKCVGIVFIPKLGEFFARKRIVRT